ncbi:MAG: aminodeoxychorismate/anthranilate synthase component II [Hyphomicrobiales bacterium]
MRLLILDNYDSFTYNLVQCIEKAGCTNYDLVYNDEIIIGDVDKYDKILLSPGPGIPSQAGLMPDVIREYAHSKSILGVCLGHQAIAESFGAKVVKAKEVLHGVVSELTTVDQNELLFGGIADEIEIGRYHSWVVDEYNLPECIKITARSEDNEIMALSHTDYDVRGVQFHPESIMTPYGQQMIENWLSS